MAFNERIFEREEVITGNPHPIMTGISSAVILVGIIAFACLAIASTGCGSPPDSCSEVDKCDDDVDGGDPDQPDSNGGNCATNGTCPDAASNTDGPSTVSCAANAWMENPAMFDCDFVELDGTVYRDALSCDPQLSTVDTGCAVLCGPFWASPEQLLLDLPNHSFDYWDTPDRPHPKYRCHQRQ